MGENILDLEKNVHNDNTKESYNYFLYLNRLEKKYSRKKMAKELNIRHTRYSFIERGYVHPNKKEIKKISEYYGIDYSEYLEGISSYPNGLPEKEKTKFIKALYRLISKPIFKITNAILILLSICLIILCFSLSNHYSKESRDFITSTYLNVFDEIKTKGSSTISFTTNEITRPEIFINNYAEKTLVSITGSYIETDVLNMKYTYSIKNDNEKIVLTANMKNSLSKKFTINANYTYLQNYKSYYCSYYFDIDTMRYIEKDKSIVSELDESLNSLAKIHIEEAINNFNYEMETLINDKLGISVNFTNDMIINVMAGKAHLLRCIIILYSSGLLAICLTFALIYLLIYSFLYGNEKNTITIFQNSTSQSDQMVDMYTYKKDVKKDVKFFPILPESLLKIIGIILTCAGSIRILLIFLKYLGFFPDSPVISSLTNELNIWFSVGLFLIFFINFDIFKDDRRSIRNVFLYFIVFIALFTLELIIIYTVKKFAVARMILDETTSTLPNYFGTICCYFLIMLFLFNNPKWANTPKKLAIFRSFSIIPIIIIITTTIINYVSKMNNWDIPLWVSYLVNTGRPQISILCVLYLIGLYFMRVGFKIKYGNETCKRYFNGNRYMWCKNILMTVLIIIISLFELILSNNTTAHKFDLGLYPQFIFLAPLMMLYHPHVGGRNKRSDYVILGLYIFFFGIGYLAIGVIMYALFL